MRIRQKRMRRAAVIVQLMIGSAVVLGMAALVVDLGAMYGARTELQAAADSAALAAAAELAGNGVEDPRTTAQQVADRYARLNAVAGLHTGVDPSRDVEFGRAVFDPATDRFVFTSDDTNFNAVRVTVRRTDDSEGGPLALSFAQLFGVSSKSLWARASAVLIPRDIAVVIDLSGSMNDDSELQHYRRFQGDYGDWRDGIQVNLRDIWCALDGPRPARPYVPAPEGESEYAGDTGPTVGLLTNWGSELVPETYDPTTDPGLFYIPKNQDTVNATIQSSLLSRGYPAGDVSILMSGSRDGSGNVHRNRVAAMLGLATWRSGRAGGFAGGDGDSYVEDSEMSWSAYPSFRRSWTWSDYISYVNLNSSSSSRMYSTNPDFRYRYGLKTLTNFLLEKRAAYSQNYLYGTPEQPLQAVKDAVQAMTSVIESLDSLDQMSLEIFAQTASHEVNLTEHLQAIPDRLYDMQASHYNSVTNIAGGVQQGIAELTGPRARPGAAKVLVLMSDGKPNVNQQGDYVGDNNDSVVDWCYQVAQQCADQNIRLYTIGVGQDADRQLMTQMATLGGGQYFHAEGTPEEYSDQLNLIFRSLGGRRPVALIE